MNKKTIGVVTGAVILSLIKRRMGSKSDYVLSPFGPVYADERSYPSIFMDTDGDGIPNADDPEPFKASERPVSIQETLISEQIKRLVEYRNYRTPDKDLIIKKIDGILDSAPGSYAYGRVKTPYSIINKLRRKRLETLDDVVGVSVVTKDKFEAMRIRDRILSGDVGRVVEFIDYYSYPTATGYRAYHFILEGIAGNVEIQLKTSRQKFIGDISHKAYKSGEVDPDRNEYLTSLADHADNGHQESIDYFDYLIQNGLVNSFLKGELD